MFDYLRAALNIVAREDLEQFSRSFVRQHILGAFKAAKERPSHATPILSKWMRTHRSLGSKDRRRVSDAVYDMIRYESFFKHAGFMSPEAQLEAWCLWHNGERFGSLKSLDPCTDLSISLGLPHWMVEEWITQLGISETVQLAQTINQRADLNIRCYPHRISREELLYKLKKEDILSEPVPRTAHGLRLTQRCNIQGSQAFRDGLLDIQDTASQRFCENLEIPPQHTVIDFCAGAGGKALFLASLGANVFINDPRSNALKAANDRAKRARVTFLNTCPTVADFVVVDAPCSGSGRLRREPALRWRYPLNKLEFDYPKQQHDILKEASQFVKTDGSLVYATCSQQQSENNPSLPGWKRVKQHQLWPHRDGCDGFGWTILQRSQMS